MPKWNLMKLKLNYLIFIKNWELNKRYQAEYFPILDLFALQRYFIINTINSYC